MRGSATRPEWVALIEEESASWMTSVAEQRSVRADQSGVIVSEHPELMFQSEQPNEVELAEARRADFALAGGE